MADKTFIRFLQEQAVEDKLAVSFPVTQYMGWAGIPFEQIEDVLEDVTDKLHSLMNYLSVIESKSSILPLTKYTRIIPSFTVIGTVIIVEFCDWIKEERGKEDWLVRIAEFMEADNEHSRIY